VGGQQVLGGKKKKKKPANFAGTKERNEKKTGTQLGGGGDKVGKVGVGGFFLGVQLGGNRARHHCRKTGAKGSKGVLGLERIQKRAVKEKKKKCGKGVRDRIQEGPAKSWRGPLTKSANQTPSRGGGVKKREEFTLRGRVKLGQETFIFLPPFKEKKKGSHCPLASG